MKLSQEPGAPNLGTAATGSCRGVDIEEARSELRQAQEALVALGYDFGDTHDAAASIDGVWGPGTRDAVLQFQSDNDLERTGQLDEATLSALLYAEEEGRRTETNLDEEDAESEARSLLTQGVHESLTEVMQSIDPVEEEPH